ncbi:MAG: polysaccharide biosynthesis protein [Clostridiales Family XIII bacterium]|jgi:FlaA1/EpsC-like NDP-sugar epimerase|nr:polysaccharide biosynthesis protein [Clostridiales Family XIII bacterium]
MILVLLDVAAFSGSYFLTWMLATDEPSNAFPRVFFILIAIKVAVFFAAAIYRILFEYANANDYRRILLATGSGTLAAVTAATLIGIEPATQPVFILLSFFIDLVLVFVVRFVVLFAPSESLYAHTRAQDEDGERRSARRHFGRKSTRRVMIVGTEVAAAGLIEQIENEPNLKLRPEVVVIEDKNNDGMILRGVEMVHGRKEIRVLARRKSIDEIWIANPVAGRRQIALTLRECVKTRCTIRMLPPRMSRMLREKEGAPVRIDDLKQPTISDYFGRERPHIDHKLVGELIRGRVVLVTGGAGTYGAELCRQILRYKPRRLIALDTDEDNLALLAAEIGFQSGGPREAGDPEFRSVVASVRDVETMRRVFSAFRPHLVFHAAELKQIPLIQTNPREAFLTNIVGLQICADLADEYAAQKLILASTVRARVPVSVAAACKRVAEMYALEKDLQSEAAYTVVRFPNLIEARGNVIDIFERQLALGGPLTVADKDLAREYVSAEETALLTLQAAAYAEGGEIYEIGPGERTEIYALAEAVIRLGGRHAYEDVDITITQLRSGEKPYEDAAVSSGQMEPVSDRLWLTSGGKAAKLPHWSELWYQNPGKMDDADAVALLGRIFPSASRQTAAQKKDKKDKQEPAGYTGQIRD